MENVQQFLHLTVLSSLKTVLRALLQMSRVIHKRYSPASLPVRQSPQCFSPRNRRSYHSVSSSRPSRWCCRPQQRWTVSSSLVYVFAFPLVGKVMLPCLYAFPEQRPVCISSRFPPEQKCLLSIMINTRTTSFHFPYSCSTKNLYGFILIK